MYKISYFAALLILTVTSLWTLALFTEQGEYSINVALDYSRPFSIAQPIAKINSVSLPDSKKLFLAF
ncbi:hypothetical protein Q783_00035 [Carnobacterium inhibens subsp. gilichinskyi]|uniref:Uncharacterized protein n=1 Tax=Carnobacterium inhibens subsp. gilichinskyi TaxID=1266845 RepID=U5SCI9_9LACT|nr:hypothetical protein Q783_00035 [Carnobacterium inhibens subsp. gilichinskyi]